MNLKQLRMKYGISQKEAALCVNVPLRTYIRYEQNDDANNLKYQRIIELLKNKYEVTETNGVYSVDDIKRILSNCLKEYGDDVSFCYLFGSYAKGYATNSSDIDICINTTLKGLSFVGLIEKIRQELKKEVDVVRLNDLKDNLELLNEIMKDGIKIYG